MTEHDVTLEHWTVTRPPGTGPGLRNDGWTLIAQNGHRARTFGTELEARRFAREIGWTITGVVDDDGLAHGVAVVAGEGTES